MTWVDVAHYISKRTGPIYLSKVPSESAAGCKGENEADPDKVLIKQGEDATLSEGRGSRRRRRMLLGLLGVALLLVTVLSLVGGGEGWDGLLGDAMGTFLSKP